MPSPGAPSPAPVPIEDSYLELLTETLEGLDLPARGQFLQRYLRAITHLDLRQDQCVQIWDEMLTRRREFADAVGRPVSLKTALMDVLSSAGLFRVPILIEYDDLKKLQVSAVTDPLTGLYNRRLFGEAFEKELNRARRYGSPLGLVILDLHRFKEVNDKFGHPRGDEVLKATASTLKKTLRTSDFAYRIGGDEFALLLPQTDAAQAHALSRRVEVAFLETLETIRLNVGVSMDHGVATFPQDGEQADQLFRVADERLYSLKHANHGKTANGVRNGSTQIHEPLAAPATPSAGPVAPPPKPISIEAKRVPEKTEKIEKLQETITAAASAAAAGMGGSLSTAPKSYIVQRKAERVSMSGTNAYAVLGEHDSRRARVVDLGFGGVALELDSQEGLPENILAVLHVPILPPVRVNLKQVWAQRTPAGAYRVGCCFVS